MTVLPITLTAAGVAALLNLWLAVRVGQARTTHKVSMGDGGNEAVMASMRAHANFVEYTPFVLVLVAVLELAQGQPAWLWIVTAIFLAGRVAHAFGMTGWKLGRPIGTIITFLALAGLGIAAIAVAYTSHGTPAVVSTARLG